MENKNLKQELDLQGMTVDETDIPHIHNILTTIDQSKAALSEFPDLVKEDPIMIIDKELIQ